MPETIPLTMDMLVVLGILVFTVLLSLFNAVRPDSVAAMVLVILGITRLLPPDQLFSGFSSEAVIALIAIMIIGAGLEKSGIALKTARWVLKIGHEHTGIISIVLMLTASFLSAFMRSLGAIAVLLPVVSRITARTGIPKSRLLMPMGFCAILGGAMTMIGSGPLILLNSLLINAQKYVHQKIPLVEPFQLFSVFPIGLILVFTGVIYFYVMGNRLLPQEPPTKFKGGTTKKHFMKTYGKGCDIFELKVPQNSPFANINLKNLEDTLDVSLSLLAVKQGKDLHYPPLRKLTIEANAFIAIMGTREIVTQFAEKYKLKLYPRLNEFSEILHPVRSGLSEAVIPPSSGLIGHDLNELHMRRNYQLHVLALYRGQTVHLGEELKKLTLRSGDTLGIFCRWDVLADFHKNPDFVVLTTSYPHEDIRPQKMWHALFFFLLAIFLIAIARFPVSVGLLLGAVGMVSTGVLKMDEAYDSVSWRTVFLTGGLIPLGLAMQSTRTTDWLTQYIPLTTDHSAWIVELGLAVGATLLSYMISAVGAVIVLIPVALDLATDLGKNPHVFALIVALAASNVFLLPMQQVNALISGPGNYKTRDFIRVGFGLTIVYWITILLVVNLLY